MTEPAATSAENCCAFCSATVKSLRASRASASGLPMTSGIGQHARAEGDEERHDRPAAGLLTGLGVGARDLPRRDDRVVALAGSTT